MEREKSIIDGREFLPKGYKPGQNSLEDAMNKTSGDAVLSSLEVPTESEFREAFTPDLSEDFFAIGDHRFRLKISNIKLQKQISQKASKITDLLKKINIPALIQDFRNAAKESEDEYVDFVNFVMKILYQIGPDVLIDKLLNLYVEIVQLILYDQNRIATIEWVEENLSFYQLQLIFFKQMEKDRIQGKIINFLAVATHLLTGEIESSSRNT